jgi:DNA adenine methylase
MTIKPFLKWVGGKGRILDTVLGLFPNVIHDYHEPFLGGGSVLLAVLSSKHIKVSGTVYASDINFNLVTLYKNVQSHIDELIHELNIIKNEFDLSKNGTVVNRKPSTVEESLTSPESYYYWIRHVFNGLQGDDRASVKASAMVLFMNKTCFRGVYREGPHGFNVPYGNYNNPVIIDEDHLRTVSALIQRVVFTCEDFSESFKRVKDSNDFMYLDPPYVPETNTSFVSYTSLGFDKDKHRTLFDLYKNIGKVRVLMSNSDVDTVHETFSLYTIHQVSCRRSINSKDPSSCVNEVLVANYI